MKTACGGMVATYSWTTYTRLSNIGKKQLFLSPLEEICPQIYQLGFSLIWTITQIATEPKNIYLKKTKIHLCTYLERKIRPSALQRGEYHLNICKYCQAFLGAFCSNWQHKSQHWHFPAILCFLSQCWIQRWKIHPCSERQILELFLRPP